MIQSRYPKFKRTISYWPYWFVGRPLSDRARLWPWVLTGLIVAMSVRYVLG